MDAVLDVLPGRVGTALLVGSILLTPPTWIGGVELLAWLGLPWTVAGVVSGVYVTGRVAISLHLLARRLGLVEWLHSPYLPLPPTSQFRMLLAVLDAGGGTPRPVTAPDSRLLTSVPLR